MSTSAFNYEKEDIVSEKVLSYDVTDKGPGYESSQHYYIYEFVEVKIKHPEAPEHAIITVLERRFLKQVKLDCSDPVSPAAGLLYAAIQNMKNLITGHREDSLAVEDSNKRWYLKGKPLAP